MADLESEIRRLSEEYDATKESISELGDKVGISESKFRIGYNAGGEGELVEKKNKLDQDIKFTRFNIFEKRRLKKELEQVKAQIQQEKDRQDSLKHNKRD